jgi:excisionase family DNA binding protein
MSVKQVTSVMTIPNNVIDDLDRLLSIEQAAEVLGVSVWTLRKWISDGKIRSAKLGSRRLIPVSELRRFINDAMTR